jgi:transposase
VVKKGLSDGSSKCSLQAPASRGKRVIILHAGGSNGWATNGLLVSAKNIKHCAADYHCDMDSALFETWFKNQLLPNIPPRSVIVMDNASYHSKPINKKPTSTTRKQDILDYMQSNKIPVPQGKNTKLALLNIIKELNISAEYRVDNLAKANNHDVLRLPPYYCVLNPIELVWSTLKKAIRRNNTSPTPSANVVDLIRREVNNIMPELWKNCINHVIGVENFYVTPPNVQQLIIKDDGGDDDESDLIDSK